MDVNDSLLEEINNKLRADDVEHRVRPWEAISLISSKLNRSISIPSGEADFIFKWFEVNGKPGNQIQGHFHQGAFYYDSEFWSVDIPLIYGQVQLNSIDALHKMPGQIKASLMSDKRSLSEYVYFWADCIDFGYAHDDLIKTKSHDEFGIQFLKAGYEELSSATSLLLEHRLNQRAIMNCRMATEMLFKSFICLKQGLSEREAKKLGHDLKKLLVKFIECSGYVHLKILEKFINVFPEIHDRYKEQNTKKPELYKGYIFAQSIGALIAREFTDRNTLQQVMPSNKPIKRG
jgi:hypothetical protein